MTSPKAGDRRLGFVVVAPPYVSNSAGIFALYRLCADLRRRGHGAFIVSSDPYQTIPGAPVIPVSVAERLCREGFAAVYSETVDGNPLRAQVIVRWVLNRPGLLGGPTVYESSELVFNYSNVYRPYIQNEIVGNLYMPTIDESVFWSPPGGSQDRTLECFYIGKSAWTDGVVDRDQALELTRAWPRREDLGKILRRCRALYCFDNSTMLIYEALLCGCPVVVIPDGTQQWHDYLSLELGTDGIHWGAQGFQSGEFDAAPVRDRLARARSEYQVQLDQLIESVAQRASSISAERIRMLDAQLIPRRQTPAPWERSGWMRRGLRLLERTLRRGGKAAVGVILGRQETMPKTLKCDFHFNADGVAIRTNPGSARVLECHVPPARGRRCTVQIPSDSIAIDPQSEFDPRNLALLLQSSSKLTLLRPWPSMARLAQRCGCRVAILSRRGKLSEIPTESI